MKRSIGMTTALFWIGVLYLGYALWSKTIVMTAVGTAYVGMNGATYLMKKDRERWHQ